MKTAIEIENISFMYVKGKSVLEKLCLIVNTGEKLGVIGPNGAGKTTLFHLLCGLLTPASGKISINGKDVVPGEFNKDTGYVFQNPDDQLFNITVYDDVAFGPRNINMAGEDVIVHTEEALSITGVEHLKDRAPHHLSGGEKRMAAIASVLSMNPEIMIYDEPSSNLDMRSRRKLIEFINSMQSTVLISSHDLEFILETCTRVIILDDSSIVTDGEAKTIMNDEEIMTAHGLERPHSLLHATGQHSHRN